MLCGPYPLPVCRRREKGIHAGGGPVIFHCIAERFVLTCPSVEDGLLFLLSVRQDHNFCD